MALSQLNALSSSLDEQQLVNPTTALRDLSSEQVAWVSGYLAGLGTADAPVATPRGPGERFGDFVIRAVIVPRVTDATRDRHD